MTIVGHLIQQPGRSSLSTIEILRLYWTVLERSLAATHRYEEINRLSPAARKDRGVSGDLSRHIYETYFS